MSMKEINYRQMYPGDPLYPQLLQLRNQILRLPIGKSLFDEDLSKTDADNVTLIAVKGNPKKPPQEAMITQEINDKEDNDNTNHDCNGLLPGDEQLIGCVMLAPVKMDISTFKLRQMAIYPDYQGKGVGKNIIQFAEQFCKNERKSRIILHARKHATGFYSKLGFKLISDEFEEIGIPHFAMEKILS